jgi:phosphoribosylamine--glycine ligase
MAVSGGYPGEYEKGYVIRGLDKVNSAESILFHAGTITKDGKPVTNGGRVLCITSFGDSILKQLKKSKEELRNITFTGHVFQKGHWIRV